MLQILRSIRKQNKHQSITAPVRKSSQHSSEDDGPVRTAPGKIRGFAGVVGEFSRYLMQKLSDLIFRKRQDSCDNPARALGILMLKRAEKNADWSGRRTVDVRWTRIAGVVILNWLSPRNEAGRRGCLHRSNGAYGEGTERRQFQFSGCH